MDIEGDVLQHVETVRHSNAGEDEVDGVGLHVLVGEDENVDNIEHTTKQTDQQRQVTMYGDVNILKIQTFKNIINIYYHDISYGLKLLKCILLLPCYAVFLIVQY